MALFNRFPFSNAHELNLDWILKKTRENTDAAAAAQSQAASAQTQADTALALAQEALDAVTSGPVVSVAGKTGIVTLDGDDVAYDPGDSYADDTVGKAVNQINSAIQLVTPELRDGSPGNPYNAYGVSTKYVIPTNNAPRVRITITKPKVNASSKYLFVVDFHSQAGGLSSNTATRFLSCDPWLYTDENFIEIPAADAAGIAIAIFEYGSSLSERYPIRVANSGNCLAIQYEYNEPKDFTPSWANGTNGNPSNAYYVHNQMVIPMPEKADSIRVNIKNHPANNLQFYYTIWAYNEINILGTKYQSKIASIDTPTPVDGDSFYLPMAIVTSGAKSYALSITAKLNGADYALRAFDVGKFVSIHYDYSEKDRTFEENAVDNARHIKSNAGTPLTLVHLSDIHGELVPYRSIIAEANRYGDKIDDIICTGDMRPNTGGEIASWWDPKVMTCIGNHDSATYSNDSYNWTAVSMADRDAYYIAPFESNWGVIHTSGKSYYYKDYATQKVRLIVMDGMLYTNPGTEAADQTTWLTNLLADAITNSLHVIIAIHAPHGGATAKVCSFSRYNQGTMPTYTDCNTPQDVIDAVDTKITGGLKFVGYLVGHTHQDNIWDAENNGKQLMYGITCAATSDANTNGSDQDRQHGENAFNIVTIDTTNTLVKIVRCGGADIDDHMRTRKAICFNYSSGQMVGEVL